MTSGADRRLARQRVEKILALGLIWGIGVLALLSDHVPSRRPAANTRATPATAARLIAPRPY